MSVQLHYYGSVFDLDPNVHVGDFRKRLDKKLSDALDSEDGIWLRLELDGGGLVDLLLRAGSHVALVTK